MSERRARLGRYAVWHFRDYMRDKAIATLFVVATGVLVDWLTYRDLFAEPGVAAGLTAAQRAQVAEQLTEQANHFLAGRFAGLIGALTLIGALFATNGIISDDRKHGYYRFLFAKPANVPRFYAYKLAAHLVGFLFVGLAFLGVYAMAFRPFMPDSYFPVLALLFIAFGGIGFLLSATWRVDWLSLIVVFIAAELVWVRLGPLPGWRWLAYLFPPVHKLGGVYQAVGLQEALPRGDLAWLVGYGVVCFLLGLVVLRFRPLSTD